MKIKAVDHISVCIASYNRPVLLQKLLNSLINQITHDKFEYSIVVIDNDRNMTAQKVVLSTAQDASVPIQYFSQPVQNISLARNLSVQKSCGNFVAFIDDDEYAEKDWLLNLYEAMKMYDCKIVHGPVYPSFDPAIPMWVKQTKYFDHQDVITGSSLYKICATNNCLVDRAVLDKFSEPFNPKYGLTGGEDTDFFERVRKLNFKFCWSKEAIVHEYIGLNRAHILYIVRRSFRGGNAYMTLKLENRSKWVKIYNFILTFLKSIIFLPLSPLFLLMGVFDLKYPAFFIVKIAGFAGQISAVFNVEYIQYQFPC